jgi:tetratricopeptide (TPR) repeat protein
VMQVTQDMPTITRRKLLQLSGAAVFSSIGLPTSEHVSEEERVRVTEALGKSIKDGWTLFQTSKTHISQVMAIAQAQLLLIKQVESLISPIERSLLLSGIYRLIGTGLMLQGLFAESLRYSHSAHIAALESGDTWHTIQSLLCLVNSYHELERYADAAQTIEMAFRLSEYQADIVDTRSKAHILGCWADNAMLQGKYTLAQKKLDEAATYLDQISPNEEFDHAAWLSLRGKNAFITRDYSTAIHHFEKALHELLPTWTIGKVIALIPLMVAYACKRERGAGLTTAQKALEAVQTLNSPATNRLFIDSVEQAFTVFSQEKAIQMFLKEVQHLSR